MARLTSVAIFNTGPYQIDGIEHKKQWANPEGRQINIRKSLIWIGLDIDARADIYGQLLRSSDQAVINPFCWDRYGNPVGPHQHMCDFQGDDFMELGAKDSITLYYYAQAVPGKFNAHVAAWLWYY
jgi:hypothetical protein